jgi:hypothetical protein
MRAGVYSDERSTTSDRESVMHPSKAANKLAMRCDRLIDAWVGVETNPQMAVALDRAVKRMEQALEDYKHALELDRLRRTDDPRVCTWPRCTLSAQIEPNPTDANVNETGAKQGS